MSTADLEYLDAYMSICQLKAAYCRTLDTRDWDAYTALFTEDYVLNVQGVEPIHGRDKAMAFVQTTLATTRTAHQVHAPEIEVNGNEAFGIWALQDRNTWSEPRNGMANQSGYAHYRERYVKQNGEWKIAALKLEYLHLDYSGEV